MSLEGERVDNADELDELTLNSISELYEGDLIKTLALEEKLFDYKSDQFMSDHSKIVRMSAKEKLDYYKAIRGSNAVKLAKAVIKTHGIDALESIPKLRYWLRGLDAEKIIKDMEEKQEKRQKWLKSPNGEIMINSPTGYYVDHGFGLTHVCVGKRDDWIQANPDQELVVPAKDSLWRHYKGDVYQISEVGTMKKTGEICIVYFNRSEPYKKIWIRTLKEWYEEVEYERKKVPSFTIVD